MVYRRVVMVRLILMFMLRYFWVSDAPKGLVSDALKGWFQWVSDAPEGLVSRVYGGPVGSEVFESFGQGFSNEEATYFGSEICELAVQLLSCLILIRVNV